MTIPHLANGLKPVNDTALQAGLVGMRLPALHLSPLKSGMRVPDATIGSEISPLLLQRCNTRQAIEAESRFRKRVRL
jgi:hypothetical protein